MSANLKEHLRNTKQRDNRSRSYKMINLPIHGSTSDMLSMHSKDYIVTVDHYSKFFFFLIPTAEALLAPKSVKPNPVAVKKGQMCIRITMTATPKRWNLPKLVIPWWCNQFSSIVCRRGIITKEPDNRSYEVEPEDGHATWRSRIHLRPASELAPPADKPGETNAGDNAGATAGTRPTRIRKPVERYGVPVPNDLQDNCLDWYDILYTFLKV